MSLESKEFLEILKKERTRAIRESDKTWMNIILRTTKKKDKEKVKKIIKEAIEKRKEKERKEVAEYRRYELPTQKERYQPYSLDWTQSLRRSIRERDHYTCQLCGKLQSDKAFCIHHIDYDKLNCNINNLIILCESCHGKTLKNREYYKRVLHKKIIRD